MRNTDRFTTHPFRSKTGTAYVLLLHHWDHTDCRYLLYQPALFWASSSEILSPSHLRCSGYEKQFPVCQFPWRLAEDHSAGGSLAARRKEKKLNAAILRWFDKPELIVKRGRNTSCFPLLCQIVEIKRKRWHCYKRHVDYKIFIVMFMNFCEVRQLIWDIRGSTDFFLAEFLCAEYSGRPLLWPN